MPSCGCQEGAAKSARRVDQAFGRIRKENLQVEKTVYTVFTKDESSAVWK